MTLGCLYGLKCSESGTGVVVESLERFTQNQRVIEEYTTLCLAGISSELGRLLHVAMLRDVSTGRYFHPGLEEVYSEPAVHQALLYCHEEIFEQFLEIPLEQQEWDLRLWLAGLSAPPWEAANRWLELEFFRLLVPLGTPAYLRDLFYSNLRVILGLIVAEHSALQSVA
jgi:hypothetical protein